MTCSSGRASATSRLCRPATSPSPILRALLPASSPPGQRSLQSPPRWPQETPFRSAVASLVFPSLLNTGPRVFSRQAMTPPLLLPIQCFCHLFHLMTFVIALWRILHLFHHHHHLLLLLLQLF